MFKRIDARLALEGMTKRQLSKLTGIAYTTLMAKFRGASKFTLDEALAIKQVTNAPETIEELFAINDDTAEKVSA